MSSWALGYMLDEVSLQAIEILIGDRSWASSTQEAHCSFWICGICLMYSLKSPQLIFSSWASWHYSSRFWVCVYTASFSEIPLSPLQIQRTIFLQPTQSSSSPGSLPHLVLLPFSPWLLDHTRYFSQMIISFRRMAIDILASLLFIVVFFTGFFVAFSVTFGNSI